MEGCDRGPKSLLALGDAAWVCALVDLRLAARPPLASDQLPEGGPTRSTAPRRSGAWNSDVAEGQGVRRDQRAAIHVL
jgi:hypothetical protein